MNNFNNKVVIVTGARTGIGLSTATLFAKAGANVVLAGRHEPNLVYKITSKYQNKSDRINGFLLSYSELERCTSEKV